MNTLTDQSKIATQDLNPLATLEIKVVAKLDFPIIELIPANTLSIIEKRMGTETFKANLHILNDALGNYLSAIQAQKDLLKKLTTETTEDWDDYLINEFIKFITKKLVMKIDEHFKVNADVHIVTEGEQALITINETEISINQMHLYKLFFTTLSQIIEDEELSEELFKDLKDDNYLSTKETLVFLIRAKYENVDIAKLELYLKYLALPNLKRIFEAITKNKKNLNGEMLFASVRIRETFRHLLKRILRVYGISEG
ncbi:MAG: hypothetical protein ACMG57_05335 [Candidatus Dojkabacteria bacterium]